MISTPLEKRVRQLGLLFSIYGKNKIHVPNQHPVHIYICYIIYVIQCMYSAGKIIQMFQNTNQFCFPSFSKMCSSSHPIIPNQFRNILGDFDRQIHGRIPSGNQAWQWNIAIINY